MHRFLSGPNGSFRVTAAANIAWFDYIMMNFPLTWDKNQWMTKGRRLKWHMYVKRTILKNESRDRMTEPHPWSMWGHWLVCKNILWTILYGLHISTQIGGMVTHMPMQWNDYNLLRPNEHHQAYASSPAECGQCRMRRKIIYVVCCP